MKFNLLFLLMVIFFSGLLVSGCSLTAICPPVETDEPIETCATPAPCPTIIIKPSIVGTWDAVSGVTNISFRFQADGVFIYVMNGTVVGRGQYALLETIEPVGLTMVFDDGTVIYPIFTFLDTNTIKLENSLPGEPRPIVFSDFLILTRFIP